MLKRITAFIIVTFFLINISLSQQTVLYLGLTGKQLRDSIVLNYKPLYVLPYDTARDTLYGIVDIHKEFVECIYTGDSIPIDPDSSLAPRTQASNLGYSTEHAYPQSMGAATGNPQSNINHLFPVRQDVNSSRSNLPYMDVPDSLVTRWWRLNYSQTNIPDTLKEEYSKRSSFGFEVRDKFKGNAARAVFYFYTMYQNEAETSNPDYFNTQLKYIRRWHSFDEPDSLEYVRNERISPYQSGKTNPFITDTTLVKRAYGIDPPKYFNLEVLDETHVKLSWIKNDANDNVIIVRNISGQAPDPLDGQHYQSGQWGLNGYILASNEDSLIDILPQMGTYYYRIYSFTDTNTYSVGLLRFSTTGFTDAIHYWNFNNNPPEFGQQWGNNIPAFSGSGVLNHNLADVQSFQGTILNTQQSDVAGGSFCPKGLINNDSSIVLSIPVNDYKDIVFSYATRSTSTGYNTQSIYYSIDGNNFNFLTSYIAVNFDWLVRTIDFSDIPGVNDNPLFKIKIIISGATSTLGNNRFDNFKITGNDKYLSIPDNKTLKLSVFPNPANEKLNICFNENIESSIVIEVLSLQGQPIYKKTLQNIHTQTTYEINTSSFNAGFYIIRIVTSKGTSLHKVMVLDSSSKNNR